MKIKISRKEIKKRALDQLFNRLVTCAKATFIIFLVALVDNIIRKVVGFHDNRQLSVGYYLIRYTIYFLIYPVIKYGLLQIVLTTIKWEKPSLSQLFTLFNRYFNTIALFSLYFFAVLFGTMCFIIPGIIMSVTFIFAPYIFVENPEITAWEALCESSRLTDGYKWDIFVFELSYIGWILLSIPTLGLSTLFVKPYITAGNFNYCCELRKIKNMPLQITNAA